MKRIGHLLPLAIFTLGCVCPAAGAGDIFLALTEGVTKLVTWNGLPGPLEPTTGRARWSESPWVPLAFCPYSEQAGSRFHPGVLAAARQYGGGRVFAIGHEWYFGNDIAREDNERFGRNVAAWLDPRNGRRICFRRTTWSNPIENNLVAKLASEGYSVSYVARTAELTGADLDNVDMLIYSTRWDDITASEIDAVVGFASRGGGVLLTGLGWSYRGYIDKDLDEFPMNQIGRRFGIRFEDGFLHNPDAFVNNCTCHPLINAFYPDEPGSLEPLPGEGPSVTLLEPSNGATNVPVNYEIRVKVRDDKPLNVNQINLTVTEGAGAPRVLTVTSPQCVLMNPNPDVTELELAFDLRINDQFPQSIDVFPWDSTVDISCHITDSDGHEQTTSSRFQTEAIRKRYTVLEPHPFSVAAILPNDITQCGPVAVTYLLCYWDDVACTDDGPFEELVQGGDGSPPNQGDIGELRNLVDREMNYVPGGSSSYWNLWGKGVVRDGIRGVFSTRYPGIELPRLFPDFRLSAFIDLSGIIETEMKAGRPFLYGFVKAPHVGVAHWVIVYGWIKGTCTQWFLIADSAGWGRAPYHIPYDGPVTSDPMEGALLGDILVFAVPDLVLPELAAVSAASGGAVSAQPGGRYEGHSLSVPPGALAQDTLLYVGPPPADVSSLTGAVADFGPSGTLFSSPATLTLQFRLEDVAAGHNGEDMRLYRWNGSLWDIVPGATADSVGMTVSAPVDHLSTYCAAVPTDMDGDGLDEMNEHAAATDPMDPDTDWDGISDYAEIAYDGDPGVYNPYNRTENPTGTDLDATSADTDGDGIDDGAEIRAATSPLDPADYIPLGDFNRNRRVDFADYSALARSWLAVTGDVRFDSTCDISPIPDSRIDAEDLARMAGHWLESSSPPVKPPRR